MIYLWRSEDGCGVESTMLVEKHAERRHYAASIPTIRDLRFFCVDLDAFPRCDIDPCIRHQIVISLIVFYKDTKGLYTGFSGYEEINQCKLLVVRSNLRCASFLDKIVS